MTLSQPIELYKPYRTRGGWKAEIAKELADGKYLVWHEEVRSAQIHNSDGKAELGFATTKYDLIALWVEPEKVEFWLACGGHMAPGGYTNFEFAMRDKSRSRTHIYHFTGTLGEALTGECVWSKDGGEQ
ncbi:MAG: hypothetical protein AAF737_04120 [Pseudomonadota bacterium]